MNPIQLADADVALVESLVEKYAADKKTFDHFAEQVVTLVKDADLASLYHSFRWRVKDPSHLYQKLARKISKRRAAGQEVLYSLDNLYEKINDLVGVRLLHLHTGELESINARLLKVFDENHVTLLEGPRARVWDSEYRDAFQALGIETTETDRMYTSVHYVIQANRKTKLTAEIQVRTLAEELWGEVDHAMNYPAASEILACREQLRVLARVASSCTRLVDAIYRTRDEVERNRPKGEA